MNKIILLLVFTFLLFQSCKKDDSPVAPTSPNVVDSLIFQLDSTTIILSPAHEFNLFWNDSIWHDCFGRIAFDFSHKTIDTMSIIHGGFQDYYRLTNTDFYITRIGNYNIVLKNINHDTRYIVFFGGYRPDLIQSIDTVTIKNLKIYLSKEVY